MAGVSQAAQEELAADAGRGFERGVGFGHERRPRRVRTGGIDDDETSPVRRPRS
jgi:hypothetical protein